MIDLSIYKDIDLPFATLFRRAQFATLAVRSRLCRAFMSWPWATAEPRNCPKAQI